MSTPIINFIGCGKLGRTLGRLWQQRSIFRIGDILTRSQDSALAAAEFIGAGRPVTRYEDLAAADLWLLACSDDALSECMSEVLESGQPGEKSVVFHCSGSLPSSVLTPRASPNFHIASVHPVISFADPAHVAAHFEGTYCGIEGDEAALEVLQPAFTAIGARLFTIDATQKSIYHAASVFACNYLVALEAVSLQCFERAGVTEEQALEVLGPILRGTLDNLLRQGPIHALTGPIARGDAGTVARQMDALQNWQPDIAALYRALGVEALKLAKSQRAADPAALDSIETRLTKRQD